jgi:hypothetical protein
VLIEFDHSPSARRLRRSAGLANRRTYLKLYSVGAIAVLIGVVGEAVPGDVPDSNVWNIVGLVVIMYGFTLLIRPRQISRQAANQYLAENPGGVRVRLTETEAGFHAEHASATFRWTGVRRIDERGGFWFAHGNHGRLFTVAAECMGPGQELEFRTFLVERGLAAPVYRL